MALLRRHVNHLRINGEFLPRYIHIFTSPFYSKLGLIMACIVPYSRDALNLQQPVTPSRESSKTDSSAQQAHERVTSIASPPLNA